MQDSQESIYRPPTWWPAVVMLQGSPDAGELPMRAFTEGIANSLVQRFGDRVLLILAEPGNEEREPSLDDGAGPARLTVFVPPDDPVEASRRLLLAIERHWQDRAYLIVDPSVLGPAFTDQMVSRIGAADLDERLFRKLVQVQTSQEQPLQESADTWRRLRTHLLTGAPPSGRRLRRREIAAWLRDEAVARWVRYEREPKAEPYPNAMHGDEFVRIRMSYQPTRDGTAAGSFDRWARAVSNRRVGLALGGSGAWGYAHAALIDRLSRSVSDVQDDNIRSAFAAIGITADTDVQVPIDLIASSSSGSMIGGYYAVLGQEGLERALDRGPALQRVFPLATVSMAFLEAFVARDVGFPRIDDLELLFCPVVTNLTTTKAEYVQRSSVPWGVRASGSFPGIFASTLAAGAVYCDGAIADNVPATLVDALGADLVIATNPLPPPEGMKVDPPSTPVGQFLREWNPIFRAWELLSATSLMLHTVGEFEAQNYLLYDPPSSAFPLLGTNDFAKARQIYLDVLEEQEFRGLVRRAKLSWLELAKPRERVTDLQG